MGFYFRKSARFGPFRINFSKSGIGLSAGVPGFRIGSGPRGAYIQAGMGGLYYRQSLGGRTRTASPASPAHNSRAPSSSGPSPAIPPIDKTLGPEQLIESGSVLEMRDSTGLGLIEQLQACRRRVPFAPTAFAICGLLTFLAWINHSVALLVLACVGLPVAYWLRVKDIERKGFVLQYELDAGATKAATELVEALEQIGRLPKIWYLDSTRRVLDRKYHAGAGNVVKRSSTRVSNSEPPYLRTNVPVPSVHMGKQTLYFLPDRVLVYAGSGIGAVSYAELTLKSEDSRFIEDSQSSVPAGSEVVGTTWRYVNKNGGPDRRFKDNPTLPIVLYEDITFTSQSGLFEMLELSRRGHGRRVADAIAALNAATANGHVIVRTPIENGHPHAPELQPSSLGSAP